MARLRLADELRGHSDQRAFGLLRGALDLRFRCAEFPREALPVYGGPVVLVNGPCDLCAFVGAYSKGLDCAAGQGLLIALESLDEMAQFAKLIQKSLFLSSHCLNLRWCAIHGAGVKGLADQGQEADGRAGEHVGHDADGGESAHDQDVLNGQVVFDGVNQVAHVAVSPCWLCPAYTIYIVQLGVNL